MCFHCSGTGFCGCNDCMDEQFMSARTWRCRFCGGTGKSQEVLLQTEWGKEASKLGIDDLND